MAHLFDNRRKITTLIAEVIALLISAMAFSQSGCDKPKESAPPPSAVSPTTKPVVGRAAPLVDPSLTIAEYVDAGVPAHDRPWSFTDYRTAGEALRRLSATSDNLPRWHSPKSGALFDRIVNSDNLDLALDPKLPIGERLGSVVEYLQNSTNISRLYLEKSATASLDRELVEGVGFQLLVEVAALRGMHEFMATLTPAELSDPKRMRGLAQMRSGLAEANSGALEMLGDRLHLSPASRLRLCQLLALTLPAILPELPPASRREVPVRLARLASDDPDPDVRTSLAALRDDMASAATRPAPMPTTRPSLGARDLNEPAPRSAWHEGVSEIGNFRVRMPGVPIEMAMDAPTEKGGKLHMQMLATRTGDGIRYVAISMGPADDAATLQKRMEDFGNLGDGQPVQKRKLQISGRPAQEAIIGGDPPTVAMRAVIDGDHLYLLTVEGEKPRRTIVRDDAMEFMDSFRLTIAATRPTSAPVNGR